jgi:hypothetical protein
MSSGSADGIILVILEVIESLLPLVVFFTIFQIVHLKLPLSYLIKLYIGLILAAFGMVLFLHGIYNGFYPVGREIGIFFGSSGRKSWLIPMGFVLGFLTTLAEPVVRVLCYQIEESSNGYIRSNVMLYTLASSVALFVAITMVKIVYGIPFLYLIVPGYLLALVLLWICDTDFIGIAFDSGGVAAGSMAVTFLTSVTIGAVSVQEGGNEMVHGFGLAALIALAPIIFVMLLGIYIKYSRGRENAV